MTQSIDKVPYISTKPKKVCNIKSNSWINDDYLVIIVFASAIYQYIQLRGEYTYVEEE